MGAWGYASFDNDYACDWAADLPTSNDLSFTEAKLDQLIAMVGRFVDGGLGSEGLAACEVIARLKGNWGIRNVYSKDVDSWVKSHPFTPSPEMVSKALAVIDRILSEPSELLSQSMENEASLRLWLTEVNDLRRRVES
jgi:hypothetical protein